MADESSHPVVVRREVEIFNYGRSVGVKYTLRNANGDEIDKGFVDHPDPDAALEDWIKSGRARRAFVKHYGLDYP